jgi:hypothetical protein
MNFFIFVDSLCLYSWSARHFVLGTVNVSLTCHLFLITYEEIIEVRKHLCSCLGPLHARPYENQNVVG